MNESREEINEILAMMGEPPLNGNEVVGEPVVHVHGGQLPLAELTEQLAMMRPGNPADIKLPEPPGHRRSEVYFLNGRHILVDLQLEQLLERVYDFQQGDELRWWQAPLSWLFGRRRRFASYLELPQIDLVGDQNDKSVSPVVVANPARYSRKSIDTIQSMSRAWLKMVPGQLSATSTSPANGKSKLQVVRGEDASLTLEHLNRKQRRELARSTPRG